MKYFLAQIGIILFTVLAEETISKWISTWILVVSLMVILTAFLISSRFYEYSFQGAQRVISGAKFMLKSFGIFSVLFVSMFLLYFIYGGDKFPQPIKKQLHITMEQDIPCFYIEPFDGIEAFDIDGFQIIKPLMPYERYWGVGSFADKYKQIKIPLTTFTGVKQCIQYGGKNKLFDEPSKKLEMDVLYKATMEGPRRNIPKGKEEDDGNWLTAETWFYLSKNQKTGQIEAIEREQYLKDKNITSKQSN
ncbi:MAG: hypothetical protein PHO27_00285 [Sulfuricurvum sp.]|nr:hypothetical protein [Sulfuricurvum sp.]